MMISRSRFTGAARLPGVAARLRTIPCLNRSPGSASNLGRMVWLGLLAMALVCVHASEVPATPPEYKTFERQQQIEYEPNAADVLRIWVVNVGQGDALLVQLPTKFDYIAAEEMADDGARERIDILVDGGPGAESGARTIGEFLALLYPDATPVVEYAVITHHDEDHVAGITALLEAGTPIANLYHNGLANYQPGRRGFPTDEKPTRPAVYKFSRGRVTRGMAFITTNGELAADNIVDNANELRNRYRAGDLEGIYEELAHAVVTQLDADASIAFPRAYAGAPFIGEQEAEYGTDLGDLRIEVLWPRNRLKPYNTSSWSETINGNSVTFRLTYGDFAMLFTGDHNELSEPDLLTYLSDGDRDSLLACDVLKVPHHGSIHAHEPFFKHPELKPVVSVVTLGNQGFKSKAMNSRAWEHPSPEVIKWLGGAHRVYSTYHHEKRFRWSDITSESRRQAMIERTHILIETDGDWFRLVEVPVDDDNPLQPRRVTSVRRGDGTRWIRAR